MELAGQEQRKEKVHARARMWAFPAVMVFGLSTLLAAQNPQATRSPAENVPEQNPATQGGSEQSGPDLAEAENSSTKLSNEQMGDLRMARKEYADAVDYYLRALRDSEKERAEIWNKIGIAYQQQLVYKDARKAYKRAIHLDKTFSQPWNNLGTSYYLTNKAKKSLKYYQEAIKLNPESASFHLNLGTAYYKRKKVAEALTEYRTALTLDPNILIENARNATVVQTRSADAKFYFYLAKILASLGRQDEALRYLRRAMEEGFQDQRKITGDPDLKKLSDLPAFVQLMKNPPVPIK